MEPVRIGRRHLRVPGVLGHGHGLVNEARLRGELAGDVIRALVERIACIDRERGGLVQDDLRAVRRGKRAKAGIARVPTCDKSPRARADHALVKREGDVKGLKGLKAIKASGILVLDVGAHGFRIVVAVLHGSVARLRDGIGALVASLERSRKVAPRENVL